MRSASDESTLARWPQTCGMIERLNLCRSMPGFLPSRFAVLSALLLVLGTLSSIGVAVGDGILDKPILARWNPLQWSSPYWYSWQGWNVAEFRGVASVALYRSRPSGRNEILSPMVQEPPWWCPEISPTIRRACDFAHGWPLPALRVTWPDPVNPFASADEALDAGVLVERVRLPWIHEAPPGAGGVLWQPTREYAALRTRAAVPFRPVPIGLLVDSLAHAAVWLGLMIVVSLPVATRRGVRRRRGACISCGYSMRGAISDRCPECGWNQRERWPCPSRTHLRSAIGLIVMSCLVLLGLAALTFFRAVRLDPIFIAAARGDVDEVQQLLAAGISPDCRTTGTSGYVPWPADSTPLMWAAAHDQLEVMDLLLDAGANINAGDGVNCALEVAVRHGSLSTVQFMLERAAILNRNKAIVDAAHYGSTEVLAFLLEMDPDAAHSVAFSKALQVAAGGGRTDNLQYLLSLIEDSHSVEMQSVLQAALLSAISCHEREATALLLEGGTRLQSTDQSALWDAAARTGADIVQLLLENGADANCALESVHEPTPLWAAVKCSNEPVVRLLLKSGVDSLLEDDEGRCVLFAIRWHTATDELIELLLSAGLNVNHQAKDGATVLMLESISCSERGVARLLALGADPLMKDDLGRSALDLVRIRRSLEQKQSAFFNPTPYDAIEKLLKEAISSREP